MSITVYSKPMCVQCDATYRALDKQGLDYTKVDLTEDPSALEFIKGLGYQQAPVVIAGDDHWSGYRPDLIKAAAQASSMESGRVVNAYKQPARSPHHSSGDRATFCSQAEQAS